MNSEQARDLFSSYLEGTLEPGLRQQLERALEVNSLLGQEYHEFKAVCYALNATADEEIVVPGHLNARISATLDDALNAKIERGTVLQMFRWKPAAIGIAAAVAVVTAGVALFSPVGGNAIAGLVGGSEVTSKSDVSWVNNQLVLRYQSPEEDRLLLRDGVNGEIWSRIEIGQTMVTEKIQNPTDGPRIVELDVASTPDDRLIVLPGPVSTNKIEGKGSSTDLAKQIAARYQMPIEFLNQSSEKELEWALSEKAEVLDLAGELRSLGLTISRGQNGLLTLSE